jgi:hypothetical protein
MDPAEEHLAHATHPEYPSDRPPQRKTALRVLRALAAIVCAGAAFAAAAAGGAVLHLGTPPARRVLATATNLALEDTFEGRLVVERIGRLGPRGVAGVRASVRDPEARTVLLFDGVAARIDVRRALWSVLRGGDVQIVLPEVTVDHLEARLVPNAGGAPSFVRALTPREAHEAGKPEEPSRAVELYLASLRVHHGWARRLAR